jgi:hypothetical protein
MLSDNIIIMLHSILLYIIIISPFIDDLYLKKTILIFLLFLCMHFLTKYGKCGIINIERLFLKDNFKQGFFYRLIKPVISYKENYFYIHFFEIIVIYILVLWFQLYKAGIDLNILNDFRLIFNDIYKLIQNKPENNIKNLKIITLKQ